MYICTNNTLSNNQRNQFDMRESQKISISIIIPVYKVEVYIERCIKSVVTQEGIGSAYNLECILVDDLYTR